LNRTYSVVIPAYDAENTIEACLASVAAQTHAPLQALVVDDNSRDGTAMAVQRCGIFMRNAGIELRYFRLNQNSGPSRARNLGIDEATGRYVAFLDADDIWAPEKLAVIDRYMGNDAAGLLCHSYTDAAAFGPCVGETGYRAASLSKYRMLIRNPAQTSCAVIRRDVAPAFDENMRYCEDHDLWMRIAELFPVIRIVGPALTRLGRPQLSAGGLSGRTTCMRLGELCVYYNFCRRSWPHRFWLLPGLVSFSLVKHVYSFCRRRLQFSRASR
jgi:glycosyltransferase involved in cell wall biosynthesis